MRKALLLVLLLTFAAAGIAEAGQFRIAPPGNQRRHQPPHNYRESRLIIINDDDRGYAIDVDYRRNRLELQPRSSGDIYLPANSRITLTFDDDDNWRILGDNAALDIEIRSGGTNTLRLETKWNRHQVGLFGSVSDGRRSRTAQLFRYADRPGRPGGNRPPTPVVVPAPAPPRPPHAHMPPPPPPAHPRGTSLGAAVGGLLDSLLSDDHDRRPPHAQQPPPRPQQPQQPQRPQPPQQPPRR